MNIIISNSNDVPIYEQIFSQIKDAIISGELISGELLPSIRALAKELRISVITTKRAYEELERSGFIMTAPGKGCFVAGINRELMKEEVLQKVELYLNNAVSLAKRANLSRPEVIELLNYLYQEDH
ncbi:MAG: GntR family transcriptional regulator [Erysipelotrichaceae bacterium]|nr:GntR family transcriptional regulator [Erysipelotrichaceae bacterium]